MRRVVSTAVALAAVFGMASTASALAVLQVSVDPAFTTGPLTLQVTDDGPGDLATPLENSIIQQVLPSAPFNGFSYTATVGTSNEGTPTTNVLLNVQDVTRSATGAFDTIYFRFTDNNLTQPGGPNSDVTISSSPAADDPTPLPLSVRFQAFGDPNNALFGNTFALPQYNCAFASAPGGLTSSCASNQMGGFVRPGPNYSLTNWIAVQLQQGNSLGNASISTAVTATAIPEPGSLLLLGSGLAAASAAARRRRARNARA